MSRELRDTGLTLFGSAVFVEVVDMDRSGAHVRVDSIKALIKHWLDRDRRDDPPPAPPKPMSAEERAEYVWGRTFEGPISYVLPRRPHVVRIFAEAIREAESAARDEALKLALRTCRDIEIRKDHGSGEASGAQECVDALAQLFHEPSP